MKRSSFLRKIATLGVALAATVAAIGTTVGEASAWSYQLNSGQGGNITLPTVAVGDLVMPSGGTRFTLYSDTGPIAYRSPASTGAQTVNARYSVQKWNGSAWINVASSPLLTGQIGAVQTGVQFTRAYLQPIEARGYFRLTWGFDWYNASGTRIGSAFGTSNLTSDHVCVTRIRLCQSSAGFVQTGLNNSTW